MNSNAMILGIPKKIYGVNFFKKKSVLFGSGIVISALFILLVGLSAYLMENFRTMQDLADAPEGLNLTGLKDLQASGGSIPRFPTLQWKLSHVKLEKIIVNAESKPIDFIKGIPSFLLAYKDKKLTWKYYIRRFFLTGTIKERPDLIVSEESIAKKYNFNYKNLIIGSRFTATDAQIDEIVNFFDNLPKNVWVHFHCAHGLGRTSMLLVMLDIMRNAPAVPLNDIVKRQHLLGSVNLFDTVVWSKGGYTKEMLETRKKFIEDFYTFVCQRKSGGMQQWSEWNHQKKADKEFALGYEKKK